MLLESIKNENRTHVNLECNRAIVKTSLADQKSDTGSNDILAISNKSMKGSPLLHNVLCALRTVVK
jgi:hypothetical protein